MKLFFAIIFYSFSSEIFAADYIVYFSYKGNITQYKTATILTERSLQRRYRQCVSVDSTDYPVSEKYIAEIRNSGWKIKAKSKWLNAVLAEPVNENSFQISEKKFIKKIVAAGNYHSSLCETYSKNFTRCDAEPSLPQSDMLELWDLHYNGFTGKNILICVMDDGFNNVNNIPAFSHLYSEKKVKSAKNFLTGNDDVYNVGGHGTSVLSQITAKVPNVFFGAAYDADFLLARTELDSVEIPLELFNWIMAAEWADSLGADIFSTSLGYTTFDDAKNNFYYADMDGNTTPITIAAQMAAEKGILVVNSAGNEGQKTWHYISAPADAKDIITVGAVDANKNFGAFGSRGPTWDGRIKPDLCALGVWNTLVGSWGAVYNASGTSFSCPLISGLCACLLQSSPSSSRSEIYSALIKSCNNYPYANNDLGYGVPGGILAYNILTGKNLETPVACSTLDEEGAGIYPNPADEELFFVYNNESAEKKLYIQIHDLTGKIISKKNIKLYSGYRQYENNVSELANGIYYINIFTDDDILREEKFVKMNNK